MRFALAGAAAAAVVAGQWWRRAGLPQLCLMFDSSKEVTVTGTVKQFSKK